MKDTVILTQHGRLLPTALQLDPQTWPVGGRPFHWLTCPPRGSDLGFELIMEPNSCSYEPINKNHFYSRFFPLLATAIRSTLHWLCTLAPPLPRIQTLRSCFKLLGLMIKQASPLEHLLLQLRRFTTVKALTNYMQQQPHHCQPMGQTTR